MSIVGIILIVVAYFMGSIPFGLLLTKVAGLGDIREIGSGNIGTTNVLRTGNKILAAATLFFDMFKGMMAVSLAVLAQDNLVIMAAALAAIIGHMYPIWLKFKGGKGVATTFGVLAALNPSLGMAMALIWLGVAYVARVSSLAALCAFAASPLIAWLWFGETKLAILTAIIGLLVFWKHRLNIERILNKTEPKIGF